MVEISQRCPWPSNGKGSISTSVSMSRASTFFPSPLICPVWTARATGFPVIHDQKVTACLSVLPPSAGDRNQWRRPPSIYSEFGGLARRYTYDAVRSCTCRTVIPVPSTEKTRVRILVVVVRATNPESWPPGTTVQEVYSQLSQDSGSKNKKTGKTREYR